MPPLDPNGLLNREGAGLVAKLFVVKVSFQYTRFIRRREHYLGRTLSPELHLRTAALSY